MLDSFRSHESNVRGYIRLFPTLFDRAVGSEVFNVDGQRFIDFFCGAGSLNYGHNNPRAKEAILEYINRDGIQHSLDAATVAKADFIDEFQRVILAPRDLRYRMQFTGPTGTNAVEAAIKIAKKATQRSHVIAFTHAYHGHTLGALALTANEYYHDEHYGSRNNVTHIPFCGYHEGLDSAKLLSQMLSDSSSGLPKPAAIVLETVQGEGGVNVATPEWLLEIEDICRHHGILLIVDDIQVGNGRTGDFFSFEDSGIKPDIVCLSKSIGGGLPLSVVLLNEEADVWKPGEHTGTFRGNNLAFVAATALLKYWSDQDFLKHIVSQESLLHSELQAIAKRFEVSVRGRGFIQGIDCGDGKIAREVIDECFGNGLLMEASGANDEVLKVMPALTMSPELLKEGLRIVSAALTSVAKKHRPLLAQGDASTGEASANMPLGIEL